MRARNIKPGFYRNEDLAECSVWARLMFPGLWMLADREGRLEDRPKRIRADLFPYDEGIDVDAMLAELDGRGFIRRYEADGARLIQINSFAKHQNPHVNEKDSAYPPPAEGPRPPKMESEQNDGTRETSRAAPYKHSAKPDKHSTNRAESLNPESLNPESLNPESPNPESRLPFQEHFPQGAERPAGQRKPAARREGPSADNVATWQAYATAYIERYGTEPVRNAAVNGQIAAFVRRVGADEAPHIAAWFPHHKAARYVAGMHSTKLLMSDAEALRTQWATGRTMTSTTARQQDKLAGTGDAVASYLATIKGTPHEA